MRKLCIVWMLAAICVTSAVAQEAKKNENVKVEWSGNINRAKLACYLRLTPGQHEPVATICDYFEDEMRLANASKKKKDQRVRHAVYANLKLMKGTLDRKQYADYVRLMAMTLQNKGIEVDK